MALNEAGLETNDLTEFDGNFSEITTLEASTDRANNGSYGLKLQFDGVDDEAYVYWTEGHTEWWMRFYIYIDTLTLPAWATQTILRCRNSGFTWYFNIQLSNNSGSPATPDRWAWFGTALAGGNSIINFSTGAWHLVEAHWKQGSGADGGAEIKIDGDVIFTELDNDLTGTMPESLRFGAQATVPANNDLLYFDDIAYDNVGWIGATEDITRSSIVIRLLET